MHFAGAQQSLADRALRRPAPPPAERLHRESAWPGFDGVAAHIARTSDELIDLLGDDQLDTGVEFPLGGQRFAYPRSFFLEQAVIHGLEHRTEIKLILGQHGIETPDLDGWPFSAAVGVGRQLSQRPRGKSGARSPGERGIQVFK